jgi:predicted transposase YdaD
MTALVYGTRTLRKERKLKCNIVIRQDKNAIAFTRIALASRSPLYIRHLQFRVFESRRGVTTIWRDLVERAEKTNEQSPAGIEPAPRREGIGTQGGCSTKELTRLFII